MKSFALGLILLLGFCFVFFLIPRIPVVKAMMATNVTYYIRSNGNIEPQPAPISTSDNVTYTFATGWLYGGNQSAIVVERSNIIIDGKRLTLQGSGNGIGLCIGGVSNGVTNVTVENIEVKEFQMGIWVGSSSDISIVENKITGNSMWGMWVYSSSKNNIAGNNITENGYGVTADHGGIGLSGCSYHTIFGNNITANNGDGVALHFSSNNTLIGNSLVANGVWVWPSSDNVLDGGYPYGGNYWGDPADVDYFSGPYQNETGSDGICDKPHGFDAKNTDRYPLMAPLSVFYAGTWDGKSYSVDVASNSTISGFYFNPDEGAFIRFNVTGESGTAGFCRVTIPKSLLWVEDGWAILVGGEPITNYTIIPDENCTYLYFTYSHSMKTVKIQGTHVIPEFPSGTIPSLLMIPTLLAVIVYRRKRIVNK